MRKIALLVIPAILITILFLFVVLIASKDEGKGALQVTSSPKGAKIYLNDSYIGTTPLCKCDLPQMLKVGSYNVKIVLNDGNSYQDQVKISSNVLTVVDRTFENDGKSSGSIITLEQIDDKKNAQLFVISFPSNVDTLLDNNPVGKTPLLQNNLTASDHEVKLTKDGFQDKILKIRTVDGYKLSAIVTLAIGSKASSPSAIPLPLASTSAIIKTVTILQTPTGFLRVRKSPSLTSSIVANVKPGETYEVISSEANWFEIKLTGGLVGFISSDYVKEN